jgi:hypothetical protein
LLPSVREEFTYKSEHKIPFQFVKGVNLFHL